jgi:hypothetical protein
LDVQKRNLIRRSTLPVGHTNYITKFAEALYDNDEDFFISATGPEDKCIVNMLSNVHSNIMNLRTLRTEDKKQTKHEDAENDEEEYKMKFVVPLMEFV